MRTRDFLEEAVTIAEIPRAAAVCVCLARLFMSRGTNQMNCLRRANHASLSYLPRPLKGLLHLLSCSLALWASAAVADVTPATVDEAAKVLDLRTIGLFDGAEEPANRTIANLFYQAKTSVEKGFRFHEDALKKAGWKVAADAYVSEQMASGTYEHEGYKLSLSVMPGSDAGMVTITLNNHGNVDTSKLPIPDNSKPFYATPVSRAYLTSTTVEAAAAALKETLTLAGWEPYGDAGDVANYKQNAILLHVRVATAPAQADQTSSTTARNSCPPICRRHPMRCECSMPTRIGSCLSIPQDRWMTSNRFFESGSEPVSGKQPPTTGLNRTSKKYCSSVIRPKTCSRSNSAVWMEWRGACSNF